MAFQRKILLFLWINLIISLVLAILCGSMFFAVNRWSAESILATITCLLIISCINMILSYRFLYKQIFQPLLALKHFSRHNLQGHINYETYLMRNDLIGDICNEFYKTTECNDQLIREQYENRLNIL